MSVEDFKAFFVLFLLRVARSKVLLASYQVVVGPLMRGWDDECASKEILIVFVVGGAATTRAGGRATPRGRKKYDDTLGYPGEDVAFSPYSSRLALTC